MPELIGATCRIPRFSPRFVGPGSNLFFGRLRHSGLKCCVVLELRQVYPASSLELHLNGTCILLLRAKPRRNDFRIPA